MKGLQGFLYIFNVVTMLNSWAQRYWYHLQEYKKCREEKGPRSVCYLFSVICNGHV
jgi:hypothetical protein